MIRESGSGCEVSSAGVVSGVSMFFTVEQDAAKKSVPQNKKDTAKKLMYVTFRFIHSVSEKSG